MILLVDHRDSFTYNLYQYLLELKQLVTVISADQLPLIEVKDYQSVILSPGPGAPNEAVYTMNFLAANYQNIPVLGICLGQQIIASFFGGEVVRAPEPVHGKTSFINHNGTTLFSDIPSRYIVTRYHSLHVPRETLPKCLQVTAETDDGIVMALEHENLPIMGVQFHPEAILSEHGHVLLANFLKIAHCEVTK